VDKNNAGGEVSGWLLLRRQNKMNLELPIAFDSELLVIGYGNSLRRDDGVGPRVAEAIEELNLPGVRAVICQQLSPEHADFVARARRVVFVDAAVDETNGVKFRELSPGTTTQLMAHAADPRTLLALARDVFGHAPEAWWLTIPAAKLGFGTDFSPEAEAGFQKAIVEIRRLAGEICTSPGKIYEASSNRREASAVAST
jgi:hydrogenase maturation protease